MSGAEPAAKNKKQRGNKMEYKILKNKEHNGLEIYFDSKPSEQVRTALKGIKFRWHGVKKCWYGRAGIETVEAVLGGKVAEIKSESAEILKKCYCEQVDAYLDPNGGFKGSNSDVSGHDIAPMIREFLKKCGIKGVTVSQKHYSGGMSIGIKFRLVAGDILDYEEIREQVEDANFFHIGCSGSWMVDPDNENEYILSEKFFSWDADKQRKALEFWGRRWYESVCAGKVGCITDGCHVNPKRYPCFSESFFDRWNAVTRIVNSFNYDRSNSQVDYFDVNFYENYHIIAA